MKKQQLVVSLNGEIIVNLQQTPSGKMQFFYLHSANYPISINLPVREQPYTEIPCEAFFGGLLPEGDAVRRIIGKRYGVSHQNTFALLRAIGRNCAGAISFYETEEAAENQRIFPLAARIISDSELHKHIQDLPKNPYF